MKKKEWFPFSDPIPLKNGENLPAHEVHKFLSPLLTNERKNKISQVVRKRIYSVGLVLENIYDRGNSSAVLRSAEGFGFGRAELIEENGRFKASQRTTAGSDKWMEITKWNSSLNCLNEMEQLGFQIVATNLSNESTDLNLVNWEIPSVLVIGNEKEGISDVVKRRAHHSIKIPMTGFVQSFNLSVAAALCFYHIFRAKHQEHHDSTGSVELDECQRKIVEAYYYIRTLDSAPDLLIHEWKKRATEKRT